jgi:hypothetical protein
MVATQIKQITNKVVVTLHKSISVAETTSSTLLLTITGTDLKGAHAHGWRVHSVPSFVDAATLNMSGPFSPDLRQQVPELLRVEFSVGSTMLPETTVYGHPGRIGLQFDLEDSQELFIDMEVLVTATPVASQARYHVGGVIQDGSVGSPMAIPFALHDLEGLPLASAVRGNPLTPTFYFWTDAQSASEETEVSVPWSILHVTAENYTIVLTPSLHGNYRMTLTLDEEGGGPELVPGSVFARVACRIGTEPMPGGDCGCSAGFTGGHSGAPCTPCPAGEFKDTIGADACEKCRTGSFSLGGVSACTPCSAGEYGPEEGATSCVQCPPGTYSDAGRSECQPCGKFSLVSRTAVTGVADSPFGVNCSNGMLHGSLQGYWAERELQISNANSSRAWKCEMPQINPDACLGGARSACRLGHDEGWAMCSRCVEGFYLNADRLCVELPDGSGSPEALGAQYALLLLAAVAACSATFTLMCFCLTPQPAPPEVPPPWTMANSPRPPDGGDRDSLVIWVQRDTEARLWERIHRWFKQVSLLSQLEAESEDESIKQLQACSLCVFVLHRTFFTEARCLHMLRTAIVHQKPCLLVITPLARFVMEDKSDQKPKKPPSERMKSLIRIAMLPLWVVARIPKLGNMAKEAVDQLRNAIGEGDAVKVEDDFVFPENAYNDRWSPYLPDLEPAFMSKPLHWDQCYPHACMLRILKWLAQNVDPSGPPATAVANAQILVAHAEDDATSVAPSAYGGTEREKEFDLYMIFNARECADPLRWHTPLQHMGYKICLDRYVGDQPPVDMIDKTRRVVVVLTTNFFASWFCCLELVRAVELEMAAEVELILVSMRYHTLPKPAEAIDALRANLGDVSADVEERITQIVAESSNLWGEVLGLPSEGSEPGVPSARGMLLAIDFARALTLLRMRSASKGAGKGVGGRRSSKMFGISDAQPLRSSRVGRWLEHSDEHEATFLRKLAAEAGIPLGVEIELEAEFGGMPDATARRLALKVMEANGWQGTQNAEIRYRLTSGLGGALRVVQSDSSMALTVASAQQHRRKVLLSRIDRLPAALLMARRAEENDDGEGGMELSSTGVAQAILTQAWHQALVHQMVDGGTLANGVQHALVAMPEMSDDLIDALVSIFADSYEAMAAVFGKVFKVLLGFLQINASLQMSLPQIAWSEDLLGIWDVFASVNLDFLNFGSMNEVTGGVINYCTTGLWMCFAYLVWQLMIPLSATLFTRIFKTNRDKKMAFSDQLTAVSVIIMLVIYPTLSTRLLSMFKSRQFADKEVLAVDWSLNFTELGVVQAVAGVFILLYTIAIPVYFLYGGYVTVGRDLIITKKPDLTPQQQVAAMHLQKRREARYFKIYEMYDPENWYWEVLELMRKLVMIAGLVFIYPGTTTQVWVGMFISLAFLLLTVHHMPYDEYVLDVLSFVSQLCTTLTLMFAVTEKTNLLEDGVVSRGVLDGLLMTTQFAPVVAGIATLGWAVRRKLRARKEGQRMSAVAPGFLSSSPPPKRQAGTEAAKKRRFSHSSEPVANAQRVVKKRPSQVALLAPKPVALATEEEGAQIKNEVVLHKATKDTKLGATLASFPGEKHPRIHHLEPGSIAASGNRLMEDDFVTAINGVPVQDDTRASELIAGAVGDIKIATLRNAGQMRPAVEVQIDIDMDNKQSLAT